LGASNPPADSVHLNCRTRVYIVVKNSPPSRVAVLLPHEIVVIYVVLDVVLNYNSRRGRAVRLPRNIVLIVVKTPPTCRWGVLCPMGD
jgi:hypothetical protein